MIETIWPWSQLLLTWLGAILLTLIVIAVAWYVICEVSSRAYNRLTQHHWGVATRRVGFDMMYTYADWFSRSPEAYEAIRELGRRMHHDLGMSETLVVDEWTRRVAENKGRRLG